MNNLEQPNSKDLLRHLAKLADVEWDARRLEQIAPALDAQRLGMRTLMSADVGEAEPALTFDPRPRSSQ